MNNLLKLGHLGEQVIVGTIPRHRVIDHYRNLREGDRGSIRAFLGLGASLCLGASATFVYIRWDIQRHGVDSRPAYVASLAIGVASLFALRRSERLREQSLSFFQTYTPVAFSGSKRSIAARQLWKSDNEKAQAVAWLISRRPSENPHVLIRKQDASGEAHDELPVIWVNFSLNELYPESLKCPGERLNWPPEKEID
jgi:hypothetical protein